MPELSTYGLEPQLLLPIPVAAPCISLVSTSPLGPVSSELPSSVFVQTK